MDDLIEFLRARLAEDEAVARAATDGPWAAWEGRELHGLGDLIHPVRMPGQMAGSRATIVTASWLDAEHIARHDPARALVEVEAKRRLLDYLVDLEDKALDGNWWNLDTGLPFELLALPYADHPDYRPEWAPEGSST